MRLALSLAALLALGCGTVSHGARAPLWSLDDPRGDDHGDGELVYPARGDPAPGELDLVRLSAREVAGGTELEVTFAAPIRRPGPRVVSATGASLADVAKLGFYSFNVDVYVDVDRVPGSGRTDTLPGRKAELAPETAWDRALCLTPRPVEARSLLASLWTREAKRRKAEAKEAMSGREEAALERELAQVAQALVFFPTRVRVEGDRVVFFVPAEFLPRLDASFAYVAVVTGADLETKLDVGAFIGRPASPGGLFTLGIAPGKTMDRFGGGRLNDPGQPPVVDALLDGAQEEALLARPAVLRGVVPAR